ncbi:MAG: biosynthetic-type acetolactate synthase large subunit [Bacteroidales bacterium]|jgi:acetolactate synthase-1/2/3 large subunit|nr:biosynthetic-type acetolactate synthase large subunit [Bacteroidales bacterium]MDD4771179.1 biosynthetic-type acetolactate synthase large subunit [Bacteroidales bacterium]HKL91798.1 biosynthetic-type acetolactate synthase large subunit [Bacteroidales bacterium]
MESTKIKGAEALMLALIEEKVDTIFGYPGGSIINVFDEMYSHRETIKQILTRHEQGAIHAAQGYARVTGDPGVVIVTSGPGATNVITGLADAMLDSTPLVVISGQVSSHLLGTDAFQETDVIGLSQPVTKWSYQIRKASDISWAVARAFYIAREGRPGPVVLDFTKDAQNELLEFSYEKCCFIRSYEPYPELQKSAIEQAAALINSAKKPLALVGQGVILGEAEAELQAFLEKADIPAGCTLLGLPALPSDYPLKKGMLGMHGNVGPNRKTMECDVLIAIGMRFDDRVTGDLKTYAKQAKIIHFDIDSSEIGKNVVPDVAVLADVKESLPAVTELLEKKSHTEWVDSFKIHEQEEWDRVIQHEIHPTQGAITMGEVVHRVAEATPKSSVLVTDVGQNQMMGVRYFKYFGLRNLVTSGGLGTMGFGLPAALGAALGAPEKTVCLFSGDGGIQMTIQELGTIMEYDIPVKIIILNNRFLGMVRQWQELFFKERYSSTVMKNPNFPALAAAYGIPGRKVFDRSELDAAITEMIETKGAYLLEVEVEQNGMVYPMIPAGTNVNNILLGD